MELNGSPEWFMTSLVVRKVLDHFSNPELLSLSLVNKVWNFEAKSLLKARGNTSARIGTITLDELARSVDTISDELREKAEAARLSTIPPVEASSQIIPAFRNIQANACQDVINFARLIESMSVVPFCKLNFQIRDNHPGPCVPFDEAAVRSIIEAVPITRLSFSVFKTPVGSEGKHCNATRALQFVFEANAHQLREIFVGVPTKLTLNPDLLLPDNYNLSQLKVLMFDLCDIPSRPAGLEINLLRMLVKSAQNLQCLELQQSLENHPRNFENKITCSFIENLVVSVLHGSRATLVLRRDPVDASELHESILNHLAVRYFDVLPASTEIAELEATTTLLKNSWWTLTEADFDILSLGIAFRDRIRFLNMRELSVEYNMLHLCQQFPALRNAILPPHLWTHCFPNLQKLTFYPTEDEHRSVILTELQNGLCDTIIEGFSHESEYDCWLHNLQELQLRDAHVFDPDVEFLGRLCRSVTRFSGNFTFDLIELWSRLTRIEHMELDTTDCEGDALDCILCGLSFAELEDLEGKDAEFLKTVHIVPQETPITHLKHLTSLWLHFREKKYYTLFGHLLEHDDDQNDTLPSRFSKVSAGLCFSRMPNLSISCHIFRRRGVPDVDEHGYESIQMDFPELKLDVKIVYEDKEDYFYPE